MKMLNLAIIGQGRSGRDIHGAYYLSPANTYYRVKYVVEADEFRRNAARTRYPGCEVLADYRDLFAKSDVDLVVNATYSDLHYPITKDLLAHGKNVLVEKPFARTYYECRDLMRTAEAHGAVLAVFQQTFLAPFYLFATETVRSGRLGDLQEVSIRYNGLVRRWDWQTLQKKCAGSTYNTGPHPIGMALGFLNFDPNARVVYSKLSTTLTSGDADDFSKILIAVPGGPVVDVEMSAVDAYPEDMLKIQGSLGTMKLTPKQYEMTWLVPGENPHRPVEESFLQDEDGNPVFCSEKLIRHEEKGTFDGNAFNVGTATLYEQLYYRITEGRPMDVTPEMAAAVIAVCETVHAQNPLPLKY